MNIKCKYIGNYEQPKIQTEGSAGLDLFNNTDKDIVIAPHTSQVIPTGFYVEIPKGYVGLLFVRSSIGFKRLCTLSNSVGVIDSDFRGEIKCSLFNHSNTLVTISPNERIVQLVIVPYIQANYDFVDDLSETKRGEDGFGSTGKN